MKLQNKIKYIFVSCVMLMAVKIQVEFLVVSPCDVVVGTYRRTTWRHNPEDLGSKIRVS